MHSCWKICILVGRYVFLLEDMYFCWKICILVGRYVFLLEYEILGWGREENPVAGARVILEESSWDGVSLPLG